MSITFGDWTLLSQYHTGDCAACRFEKHHKAKYECNTNVWVIWVALKLEYSTYTILSIQYLRDQTEAVPENPTSSQQS